MIKKKLLRFKFERFQTLNFSEVFAFVRCSLFLKIDLLDIIIRHDMPYATRLAFLTYILLFIYIKHAYMKTNCRTSTGKDLYVSQRMLFGLPVPWFSIGEL
jgi:hypothetical protein